MFALIFLHDGAYLLLLLVIAVAIGSEYGLQIFRFPAERVAERFKAVELLVAQQHIHGGNEDGGVLW